MTGVPSVADLADAVRGLPPDRRAALLWPGDADLAVVAVAWPDLPGPIRRAILALVTSVSS